MAKNIKIKKNVRIRTKLKQRKKEETKARVAYCLLNMRKGVLHSLHVLGPAEPLTMLDARERTRSNILTPAQTTLCALLCDALKRSSPRGFVKP